MMIRSVSRTASRLSFRHASRAMSTTGYENVINSMTAESVISSMTKLDQKYTQGVRVVENDVKPIDWNYWMDKLDDKDAIATLRAEYETNLKLEATPENLEERKAHIASEKAKADKWSEFWANELSFVDAHLKQAQEEEDTCLQWGLQEYYDNMPGLEDKLLKEFEDHDMFLGQAEEKFLWHDAKELTEALKSGEELPMPTMPEGVEAPAEIAQLTNRVRKAEEDFQKDFPTGYPTI
jgi:hypothetical protein